MNIPDPAFPFTIHHQTPGLTTYYGMSLRDYFAAAALQGLLAPGLPTPGDSEMVPSVMARASYKYADAMLAERAK